MSRWRNREHNTASAVVGIDVGNVDVRVVIAATEERDADPMGHPVDLIGVGEVPTEGMRRGTVVDARRLGTAIRAAITEAERVAGHRVIGAYFSLPLTQIAPADARQRGGRVLITGADAVRDLTARARERAGVWRQVAAAAGIDPVGIVPSVLAASAAVVIPEEHERGITVVECGAEQTSVVVFHGGSVRRLGTLPVGGDHITRDLASVLGLDPLAAERLKFDVGQAATATEGMEVIVRGEDGRRKTVAASLVVAIIAARVDQIFGYVGEMVRGPAAAFAGETEPSGTRTIGNVVLCGGGAALSGIAQMARSSLGMPVRAAGAWGFVGPAKVQAPDYASVLGLIRWREAARQRTAAGVPARSVRVNNENIQRVEQASPAIRTSQTRWQAWLREFLP